MTYDVFSGTLTLLTHSSKLSPNNLKVETRLTEPADVDKSWRLAVLREPKIISLVFDVFSCMLLLAVQDRAESKICGTHYTCSRLAKINMDRKLGAVHLFEGGKLGVSRGIMRLISPKLPKLDLTTDAEYVANLVNANV